MIHLNDAKCIRYTYTLNLYKGIFACKITELKLFSVCNQSLYADPPITAWLKELIHFSSAIIPQ